MPTKDLQTIANDLHHSQRSEIVQEIVSNKPGFLVRNGILFFLFVLVILIITCWFIQYPDIVNTKAKLTSINPPKEVKTKTGGRLIRLLVKEGEFVRQNDLLGFMESQADHHEVIMVSNIIDTLRRFMQNNKTEAIPAYLNMSFQNLGEVQQSYQTFMQSFIVFRQYLSSGYYLKKKEMLQNDIVYLQNLHSNLIQQKKMMEEDLALAKQTLDANKSLNIIKVISPLDYRNEKSRYINKAIIIPQITSSIITNESSQHEKLKEILQLENDITQQKEIFSQALNTFKAQLDDWESKYLLTTPIDGKVAFTIFLQENQQLQNNQLVCFINPGNTICYAEVYLPQSNLGKIKTGQVALFKFPAYPFQEYGYVKGKIDFISTISTDSGYLTRIILPDGLNTNYKKQIQFREGLSAQVEVITQDMRLLERFYYNIIKQRKQ